MNKCLTSPHQRNSRTEHPVGLLGIPPPEDDKPRPITARERLKVLILEGDPETIDRLWEALGTLEGRPHQIWPQ